MLTAACRVLAVASLQTGSPTTPTTKMRSRTTLIMDDLHEAAEANKIAWALPWPRATRKCAAAKNYTEPDSDVDEEDYEKEIIRIPAKRTNKRVNFRPRKKVRYLEESDEDDLIIDEERSTPAPPNQPKAPQQDRPQKEFKIVRLPLGKALLRKMRAGKLFKSLPTEVHQLIMGYMTTDIDVLNYASSCNTAYDSLTNIIWRQRHAILFDKPEGLSMNEIAEEYIKARGISRASCYFDELDIRRRYGYITPELIEDQQKFRPSCLALLKSLIIDSNARKELDEDGNETIVGLNHDYIRKLVTHDDVQNAKDEVKFVDILEAILNTDINVFPERMWTAEDELLIQVIQLCLSFLILQPDFSLSFRHFELSQELVYASPYRFPLFTGTWKCRVDFKVAVSTVNFFRYHLKHCGGEGLLAEEYVELESKQRPQPWLGKLKPGTQTLGSHWKGAYTYMDQRDLLKFRAQCSNPNSNQSQRVFVDNFDSFQDITMFFDESGFSSEDWPATFESLCGSSPYTTESPPQRRLRYKQAVQEELIQYPLKQFLGTSRGRKEAHFYGRLHAIPPQAGIPGFQRITFLKFFPDHNGAYDPGAIWAYEGCVLPGNRIIIGRWWWVSNQVVEEDDTLAGPFIFWNVDENSAEPPIEKEEAMDFLEHLRDFGMGV